MYSPLRIPADHIPAARRILSGIGLAVAILVLPNATAAHSGAVLAVHGAGVSVLESDTRTLAIEAEQDGTAADADGAVRFIHLSPAGLSRFRGVVDCLTADEGGVVQISGRVTVGSTASGVVLDGLDYALTLDASGDQAFSLPRFGAPETIEPCSGGRAETVPISGGRFVVTDARW